MTPRARADVQSALRHPEDHAFMVETFGPAFFHLHINTPETICKQRYIANGCTEREFSMAINHPVEVNVSKLSLLAHEVIRNDNDIRSFEQKILKSLQEVAKN